MHFPPEILHLAPLLFCFWSNSGGNKSTSSTTTVTSTTSGASSPNVTGGGGTNESTLGVGSGSIGVSGTGARYLESGATDLSNAGSISGSSISASSGGTIQIGSPQAVDALSQIAEQLASNAGSAGSAASSGGSGSSGGATAWLQPLTQNINWSLIALVGAGVFLIYLLFGDKRK